MYAYENYGDCMKLVLNLVCIFGECANTEKLKQTLNALDRKKCAQAKSLKISSSWLQKARSWLKVFSLAQWYWLGSTSWNWNNHSDYFYVVAVKTLIVFKGCACRKWYYYIWLHAHVPLYISLSIHVYILKKMCNACLHRRSYLPWTPCSSWKGGRMRAVQCRFYSRNVPHP